ncbi:MAG: D-aminoacylase [Gemmatimonadetes bacterium]|nr:D-aminoacylase [Gemmatimonadota bacterium]
MDREPRGAVRLVSLVPLLLALLGPRGLNGAQGAAAQGSILISGGTVIDGTGAPGRVADVRISGDAIVEVAAGLRPRQGERRIDASGKVVAPGFIDMHSHADRGIEDMPDAESQIRQGITTAVVGQDGGSALPVWQFYELVERLRPAINFSTMVGHGTVRSAVLGGDSRRGASAAETESMAALVDRAMRDGAVGLSTGLEYDPGFFATMEEVVVLARVAQRYGGYYASHVRDEENGVLEAWREAIRVGGAAGIPVHISHMKLASKRVWGRAQEALALLEDAVRSGARVTGDWYPYTYWQSSLYVLIPDRDWGNRGKWEAGLEEIGGAQNVMITRYRPEPSYEGKTLAEIAAARGQDPVTVIQEMIREAGPQVGIIGTAMSEEDLNRIVRQPQVVISSDGSLRGRHPRGYGAFPRVLGVYVREKGILSLPEAIAKMTGRSAEILGLGDRGRIGQGLKADVVIIDAGRVADRGTRTNPELPPLGIEYVIVNGEVVIDGRRLTEARPGRALRRSNWQPYSP